MRKEAIGNVTFCFDHPLLWNTLLERLWKICEIRQVIFFFRTIFGHVKVEQPTTPSRALKMCRFQQTAIIYFSSLFICNILTTTMGKIWIKTGHQSIYLFKIRNVRKPSCLIIFCCLLRKWDALCATICCNQTKLTVLLVSRYNY